MKKFTLLFIAALAFIFTDANAQTATKFATAHVENGNGDTQSGRMYRVNAGASRDGNGNSNGAFGNIHVRLIERLKALTGSEDDNEF